MTKGIQQTLLSPGQLYKLKIPTYEFGLSSVRIGVFAMRRTLLNPNEWDPCWLPVGEVVMYLRTTAEHPVAAADASIGCHTILYKNCEVTVFADSLECLQCVC